MEKGKIILAVGSIAIDTLETPNGNRKNLLGGSASYFSVAAFISASFGTVMGIIPGVGEFVAQFFSYSTAKNLSKTPSSGMEHLKV